MKRKQNIKGYRKWHRRLGLAASLFLINLAITGIILNHYEVFSLHKNTLKSAWILDWYGVKPPEEMTCFDVLTQTICQLDNLVLYRSQATKKTKVALISKNTGHLINALSNENEQRILVSDKSIRLYTQTFQLIDSFDVAEHLNEPIIAAEFAQARSRSRFNPDNKEPSEQQSEFKQPISKSQLSSTILRIKTKNESSEQHQWLFDIESFELTAAEQSFVVEEQSLAYHLSNPTLVEQFGLAYQQRQITYLRFIQDLHSGQLFSIPGKIINDLAALCILLLAMTGIVTWYRRKNATTQNSHKNL